MKAVVYREYAPDDDYAKILKVEDIDSPKPKPDEVVFTNKASALNYNDIWGMRGVPIPVPVPHVSGSDVAGDVIAVGEDVQGFKVGDRVVSHSNLACRVCSACTSGREFDCKKDKFGAFKLVHYGVHIVKNVIYRKLMFQKFQKEFLMMMQQLHQ
jgi:NADPH:quinone reductase-like Zn-dependent oxidoreductase